MYTITNNNVIIAVVNVVVPIIIAAIRGIGIGGWGFGAPHFLHSGLLAPHFCISTVLPTL